MIKADLLSAVAGFADNGQNTAAEFRTFMTNVINEFYRDPVTVAFNGSVLTESENIITSIDSGKGFNLIFVKQGRQVSVCGRINNLLSGSNTGMWLTIDAAEFKPTDATAFYFTGIGAGNAVRVGNFKSIGGGNFVLEMLSALSANEQVFINATYITAV